MKNWQMMKGVFLLGATCLAAVSGRAQPVIISQPVSQATPPGGSASFNVAVAGTGPFTYQWQFNGVSLQTTNTISTVAGTGNYTFTGDGGVATSAGLENPYGVACDAAGNLYVADYADNHVRRVDTTGIITTVAGNGSITYSGDGGAATNAGISKPSGLAVDTAGNLFITDYNNRIRKVGTNGNITTVAGGGAGGDGGLATSASLSNPTGVAVDAAGNLYIADKGNNRIRKVDASGIITTFAGTNVAGFAGDGGSATNARLSSPASVALDASGNLYIADTGNNRVRKVNPTGVITTVAGTNVSGFTGDGGAATNARLSGVSGVAVDAAGDLFILDSSNHRVRLVDTSGVISTVAGSGSASYSGDGGAALSAGLYGPQGVALDSQGNVYIADSGNRVRQVLLYASLPLLKVNRSGIYNAGTYAVVITNASGSITSSPATLTVQSPPVITVQPLSPAATAGSNAAFNVTVAGPGPFGYAWWQGVTNLVQSGTNATLQLSAVTTNQNGNAYSVVITNAYGSVTSLVASLAVGLPPTILVQPVSQILLAGTNASFSVIAGGVGPFHYRWQFNGASLPNNVITTVAGNGSGTYAGDGGAATNASLNFPEGIALDAAGNLYIADHINARVRKVDANGVITTVAGNGSGTYSGDGGAATNAGLFRPSSVACDAAGNLFVADESGDRVRRVDPNGIITTVAGNGQSGSSGDGGPATSASFGGSFGVTVDAFGNLILSDEGIYPPSNAFGHGRIREVSANGIITTVAGGGSSSPGDGGPATSAKLTYPTAVALDAAGNIYYADFYGGRIRKINTAGTISTVAGGGSNTNGDGGLATSASLSPLGVTVDPSGNVYIGDFGSYRVRKVDTNGIIISVAGGGSGGDGGPATNASLAGPQGVVFDAAGNLFISDWGHHLIREVHYAGLPAYALSNVTSNNAGSYSVIVSSPYGSVTSSVVSLTVFLPPTLQIYPVEGRLYFIWNATSNLTYQLQYATNLVAPAWVDLGAPVTATSDSDYTVDVPGADRQRFYRLRLAP